MEIYPKISLRRSLSVKSLIQLDYMLANLGHVKSQVPYAYFAPEALDIRIYRFFLKFTRLFSRKPQRLYISSLAGKSPVNNKIQLFDILLYKAVNSYARFKVFRDLDSPLFPLFVVIQSLIRRIPIEPS